MSPRPSHRLCAPAIIATALFATALFACSDSADDGSPQQPYVPPPLDAATGEVIESPVDAAMDSGESEPVTAPNSLALPFSPSNVSEVLSGRILSADANVVMTGEEDCATCVCPHTLVLSGRQSYCEDANGLPQRDLDIETITLDQAGQGDLYETLTVMFVENLILRAGANVRFHFAARGPLVIVAQDTIGIDVTMSAQGGYPGGEGSQPAAGEGPGGGGFESGASSPTGEGGAFCTYGGRGSAQASPNGMTYGNEQLVPLLVGSGGGTPWNNFETYGGKGGGSLQLVAGNQIWIGPDGFLQARGDQGEAMILHGPGGGSGGAFLLEAPTVTVDGAIHAPGGFAGGYRDDPGHEGGLGWIRINTDPDGYTQGSDVLLDPSPDTGCLSFGILGAAADPDVDAGH